jgi:hypothetical protein
MHKFIENKAHIVLRVISRNITRSEFKHAYSLYRANEKYSLVGTDLFYVCHFVRRDTNTVDPLLIKSVLLAISIEQSEIIKAAA